MDKVFMDFIDNDFFKIKEFNINDFINNLGNIDSMSAFDLLDKIKTLNIGDRKKLLSNDVIRNKLRYGLLDESKDNQWYYYREIFKVMTSAEFLSLYDTKFLLNYFAYAENGEKYRFYAALCEDNVNAVVSYVSNDKEMYEDFFKNSSSFSNLFEKIDYDLLKKVILKMQNEGFKLDNSFLDDVSEECQKRILEEEEFNNDTLTFVLPMLSNKILSNFFEKESRALYLYDRFDIDFLVDRGIKFNDNILKKKDFFDLLKKDSFIEFRSTINKIEKVNNPVIIEERLEEYYNEIINCYDKETGIFKEYGVILNNPGKYKMGNSYLFNVDVVYKFSKHLKQDESGLYYYENKDELLDFLKKETSKKLSEIIVDALFRDNIYNVWLNIKEMLRYNDLLDINDKVLDKDKESFYKMILNFDNVSNDEKIEMYNKLKDKNFSYVFYNDLRKIKDVSYDKIKEKLINPSLHSEYLDDASSEEYGVDVYDLRDKEYTMLVRTSADFREVTHYRRGCYSIISNENTQIFGEYDTTSFLYGYNSFDNDMVLHMFESDSYSTNFKEESSRYVNRIMTAEQLVKANSSYSEVQILNDKSEEGKYRWTAKKPDFIVVFNAPGEGHVNESKRLGIPIVVISKKKLDKEDVIDVGFDNDVDAYVNNLFAENEHRVRR